MHPLFACLFKHTHIKLLAVCVCKTAYVRKSYDSMFLVSGNIKSWILFGSYFFSQQRLCSASQPLIFPVNVLKQYTSNTQFTHSLYDKVAKYF